MKKILMLSVSLLILHIANAQLANTKWKGILKLEDGPVNVVFNFKNDTLIVTNTDKGSVMETMTYTKTKTAFTLSKVYGQSDCGSEKGTYKYIIQQRKLTMSKLNDDCSDRYAVIDGITLTKQ